MEVRNYLDYDWCAYSRDALCCPARMRCVRRRKIEESRRVRYGSGRDLHVSFNVEQRSKNIELLTHDPVCGVFDDQSTAYWKCIEDERE